MVKNAIPATEFTSGIVYEKALTFVRENAVITVAEDTADETAADADETTETE